MLDPESRVILKEAVASLPQRDQEAILAWETGADMLGLAGTRPISRAHTWELRQRAIARLRGKLEERGRQPKVEPWRCRDADRCWVLERYGYDGSCRKCYFGPHRTCGAVLMRIVL